VFLLLLDGLGPERMPLPFFVHNQPFFNDEISPKVFIGRNT